jgi:hypothetical protein
MHISVVCHSKSDNHIMLNRSFIIKLFPPREFCQSKYSCHHHLSQESLVIIGPPLLNAYFWGLLYCNTKFDSHITPNLSQIIKKFPLREFWTSNCTCGHYLSQESFAVISPPLPNAYFWGLLYLKT